MNDSSKFHPPEFGAIQYVPVQCSYIHTYIYIEIYVDMYLKAIVKMIDPLKLHLN